MMLPESIEVLHEIAGRLGAEGHVSISTMFGRPAIRTGKKVVGFLGAEDRLILKLPTARINSLIDAGVVERVVLNGRTMREWVEIASSDSTEATLESWMPLAREAFAYVRELADEK